MKPENKQQLEKLVKSLVLAYAKTQGIPAYVVALEAMHIAQRIKKEHE